MMRVDVHYFAAARAARGLSSETVTVEGDASIVGLLDGILRGQAIDAEGGARQPAGKDSLEAVLARCSFLVNAEAASGPGHPLTSGDRVDVLPPFAGG
jgi:molybdopterin synthase sulfur carrier subunit